jgi:calcineurin-like phosphoesterase family protein
MVEIFEESLIDKITEDSYIISDTHFGHKNIMSFEPGRENKMKEDGFENHEEWLISKWNSVISEGDTVLHLGDFAFKGVQDTIKKLNGNKIFVLGNHDAPAKASKWNGSDVFNGFYVKNNQYESKVLCNDLMFSGFIKEMMGYKILFSHYPVFDTDEWDRKNLKIAPRIEAMEVLYKENKCNLNIHGHIHSNKNSFSNSINVCVEHINFEPIKIKDIINMYKGNK